MIIDQLTHEQIPYSELLERKDLQITRLERRVTELTIVLQKRKQGETEQIIHLEKENETMRLELKEIKIEEKYRKLAIKTLEAKFLEIEEHDK